MKPTLLFDADGVIINAKMFSLHLADDFGITTEETKEFFTQVFPDCIEGRADLKTVVHPYLQKWKWPKSVDEFLEYWFTSEHVIDQRLIDLILALRQAGHACHVATNQERYRTQYMKEQMQFSTWFDSVLSSADLGVKKPNLDFYARIAERLKVTNPQDAWFFDDTQENVTGAEQYGFHAKLYTGFEEFEKLVQQERWL